jgi:2-polyprenyl-3-methyl-5-hydroxy-6-metoxy-1,4-benzoquinol methylase
LEQTANPVYTNTFRPAAYLGWSRVVHAQRLLDKGTAHDSALDFGSGLGVMLPFLSQRFRSVFAYDLDPRPTKLMVERMRLSNVAVSSELSMDHHAFDVVVALDVLEHVDDLDAVYQNILTRTAPSGVWVVSGPTENWLYRLMRGVARTSGEGHVRTVADVFAAVPLEMRHKESVKLPFGSPAPLFMVARFERRPP